MTFAMGFIIFWTCTYAIGPYMDYAWTIISLWDSHGPNWDHLWSYLCYGVPMLGHGLWILDYGHLDLNTHLIRLINFNHKDLS